MQMMRLRVVMDGRESVVKEGAGKCESAEWKGEGRKQGDKSKCHAENKGRDERSVWLQFRRPPEPRSYSPRLIGNILAADVLESPTRLKHVGNLAIPPDANDALDFEVFQSFGKDRRSREVGVLKFRKTQLLLLRHI